MAAERAVSVCNKPPALGAVRREGCGGAMLCGRCGCLGLGHVWSPAPRRDPQLRPRSSQVSAPAQVKSVNLSDGEVLSIRGVDGDALVVLANQTLLVEGQVIRSPTNTISVYFRTFQDEVVGTFQLHYQGGCLSDMDARGGVGLGGQSRGAWPHRAAGVEGCRALPWQPSRAPVLLRVHAQSIVWGGSSGSLCFPQSRGCNVHRCPGPPRWLCSSHLPCPVSVPVQQLFLHRLRLQVYFFSLKSYKK